MGLTALGLILLVEARSIEGGGASHIITEVAKDCVEGGVQQHTRCARLDCVRCRWRVVLVGR